MPATRKNTVEVDLPADGWMGIHPARRALGLAYTTVCALALKGELESKVVGGRIFISQESVQHRIDEQAHR